MRLGISTGVFAYTRGEAAVRPLTAQIEDCARAGFGVLELDLRGGVLDADDWEAQIDAAAQAVSRTGVVLSQACAPVCEELFLFGRRPSDEECAHADELLRRAIAAAGKLNIPWVVVRPLTDTIHAEYDNETNLATNLAYYAPFLAQAKQVGTGLAFENTAKIDRSIRRVYGSSPEALCVLVDAFRDPDAVGICWNFGSARLMINDQPRQLRILGSRLRATHVNDNTGKRDSRLLPFISGNVRWEDIMPTLKEIGYGGDFILDCAAYMRDIPDELRPAASALALELGEYCMGMYHN